MSSEAKTYYFAPNPVENFLANCHAHLVGKLKIDSRSMHRGARNLVLTTAGGVVLAAYLQGCSASTVPWQEIKLPASQAVQVECDKSGTTAPLYTWEVRTAGNKDTSTAATDSYSGKKITQPKTGKETVIQLNSDVILKVGYKTEAIPGGLIDDPETELRYNSGAVDCGFNGNIQRSQNPETNVGNAFPTSTAIPADKVHPGYFPTATLPPVEKRTNWYEYRVQPGDTIGKYVQACVKQGIATDRDEILSKNPALGNTGQLLAGNTILLPCDPHRQNSIPYRQQRQAAAYNSATRRTSFRATGAGTTGF